MDHTSSQSSQRMPTIFLSHGAPTLADDQVWTDELAELSKTIATPRAILVVSAHWEEAPLTLGATRTVPLYHDFWGFPRRYYQVEYPAPGAPQLAEQVRQLLQGLGQPIHNETERGLDHGAYVPLVEMYPRADVPVLQISMPGLDPSSLLEVGKRLAPLRDEGALIIGSGFSTHNLREMNPDAVGPPAWSREFDDWLAGALEARSVDDLIDFQTKAPAVHLAHPTTEHFAPLFVSLGASIDQSLDNRSVIDGFWYGLSKRSVRFD